MRFGHPRILLFLVFGLWLGSSGVAHKQKSGTDLFFYCGASYTKASVATKITLSRI